MESIVSGLEDCVLNYCRNNAISKCAMTPWLNQVKKLLCDKVSDLKSKTVNKNNSEKLRDPFLKKSLCELHDKYVIAPIDKATGNVAFICKRFYAEVLIKELGLDKLQTDSGTYKSIDNINIDRLIDNHTKKLGSDFGLKVKEVNQCLPSIYWLPKMHKNPSKARFIIAASKCTVKPLSKAVTSIFKLFYTQIETYNRKCQFFTGVNTFWVTLNNQSVIKSLNKLNKHQRAKHVTTFDFSTLYTKIPHDKLLYVLNNLIDFCFDGGSSKFVALTRFGASWVDNPSNYETTFNRQGVKDAVEFLMSNCFFTCGNKVFQQIIGIPMGSDPAPFFANLFLYFYESKYLRMLQRSDLRKARRFSNVFRFIDDLIAINDWKEFEKCFKDIYPIELELGKENSGDQSATFLDLHVVISDKRFQIDLYDKRDGFPFSIVRLPYLQSNLPAVIFYSSVSAEILRIARATSNQDNFIKSAKALLDRMIKQGAKRTRLEKILEKVFGRHRSCFQNLFVTSTHLVDSLL